MTASEHAGLDATPAPRAPSPSEAELAALMTEALRGDRSAYRRVLTALTDTLQSLAAVRAADPREVEANLQSMLLAIHSKRGSWSRSVPVRVWAGAIGRYRLDHPQHL